MVLILNCAVGWFGESWGRRRERAYVVESYGELQYLLQSPRRASAVTQNIRDR